MLEKREPVFNQPTNPPTDPRQGTSPYDVVFGMPICKYANMRLPRGEIVAVVHSKGGAGKTSLTFNTAHALAATRAKVLVIDLDTQMGQRAFIDDSTPEAPGFDAGAVLLGYCKPPEAVLTGVYENLDMMPAEEQSIDVAWTQLHTSGGESVWLSCSTTAATIGTGWCRPPCPQKSINA